jgi:hypothetical protein
MSASRQVTVDLPYQNDANVALSLAEFVRNEYQVLNSQVNDVTFYANKTDELTRQALDREPGDVIVVGETVTGINAGVLIHNVTITAKPPLHLECTWGLAPRVAGDQWILDDPALSLLDDTTILGYA